MPTSALQNWPEILALIGQADPHEYVLDVGAGRGKGAVLLREYVDGIVKVDGVEAHRGYITERLRCLYDSLIVGDVVTMSGSDLSPYDIVLMVDILEHIDEEDAERLLWRIPGRVVICTPVEWFQNPEADEVEPERHRSLWTIEGLAEIRELEVGYQNEWGALLARTAPLG